MGVFLLEDASFTVSFNSSHQILQTSQVFHYVGEFRRQAYIKAIDDTPQSKNLVRVINSCVEADEAWLLRTRLIIDNRKKEGSMPYCNVVHAKVEGSFFPNLYRSLDSDLSIDVAIKLFRCGLDSAGKPNNTSLEIHIRDMNYFDGRWARGSARMVTWRPYLESYFAPKRSQRINGTITIQAFPRSYIILPINSRPFLDTPGFGFNIDDADTKDFKLKGNDGIEVWCHKKLLEGCCKLFATLLSDDRWAAGQNNEYTFQDYSGPILEAFVQYMYTSSTAAPSRHPAIALGLLELAHVYEVDGLESLMIAVLQGQPWIWFDVLTAWSVYVLSTQRLTFRDNQHDYRGLKEKARGVIQTFLRRSFVVRNESRYRLRNREESEETIIFKEEVKKNRQAFAVQFNVDPNSFL
ncbi:RCC1 and BTB domain-containing protein 2 [Orchesella cincta]|uniref:RCC1 and BTB domain-containing protein 2 n=1 Tax=Orchesella cincta TaxID=48709 RepID=A0A1D2N5Q4_ORCCI|nr:RCC1 and BTB domain-containing protein 2 [Orchesella cincta]